MFDEPMRAMEGTCKELVEHADLQASAYKAEVEQLQDRVCELELAPAQTELDSNLIISGVDESPSEDAKKFSSRLLSGNHECPCYGGRAC